MRWLVRVVRWRSKRHIAVRVVCAIAIFGVALVARYLLGLLYGANPSLTFYPAILITALYLGWQPAILVLVLCVIAGIVLFLPPGMHLLPLGWLVVGGMNIAAVAGLQALADELAATNERQRQELQHRVANTLQTVVGTLELAKSRIGSAPGQAGQMLEEAALRIAASADVHRRLNDPNLFRRGLESILRDAVATVVDARTVELVFDIEDLDLSFDQMSAITLLVIELANNAQKHVFQSGLGTRFVVALSALTDSRAVLTVTDDGPGFEQHRPAGIPSQKLGLGIIQNMVAQIHGTLRTSQAQGTVTTVEFPTSR